MAKLRKSKNRSVGDVWINHFPQARIATPYMVTERQADGSEWGRFFESEEEAIAAAQAALTRPRGASPEDLRVAYSAVLATFSASAGILAERLPSGSEWFRYFETAEEAQAAAAARIRTRTGV
jgi:hypothetical protein